MVYRCMFVLNTTYQFYQFSCWIVYKIVGVKVMHDCLLWLIVWIEQADMESTCMHSIEIVYQSWFSGELCEE